MRNLNTNKVADGSRSLQATQPVPRSHKMTVNRTEVKGHQHLRASVVISGSRATVARCAVATRTGGSVGRNVNGRRITCRHTRANSNVLIDATLGARRTFPRTDGTRAPDDMATRLPSAAE